MSLNEYMQRLRGFLIPTSQNLLLTAQMKLLKQLVSKPHPALNIEYKMSRDGMNYVVFTNKDFKEEEASEDIETPREAPRTLVLCHGYGAGLGFFFNNYSRFLTSGPGSSRSSYDRVVAVDWLGMGASKRPSTSHPNTPRLSISNIIYSAYTGNSSSADEEVIPKSINFFVDSLHSLLQDEAVVLSPQSNSNKVKRFDLAAHSLGGYLAYKYVRKYQSGSTTSETQLRGLILASPCGIPHAPPAHQQVTQEEGGWGLRLVRAFWASNGTPQQIVRLMGSRGPKIIEGSLNRRFKNKWGATTASNSSSGGDKGDKSEKEGGIRGETQDKEAVALSAREKIYTQNTSYKSDPSDTAETSETSDTPGVNLNSESIGGKAELELISQYLYHITAQPASGEYALNSLLTPALWTNTGYDPNKEEEYGNRRIKGGIFAKRAIEDELCSLKVPLLLQFGDDDWLKFDNVEDKVEKWRKAGVRVTYDVIRGGHHLYMDDPDHFHESIDNWKTKLDQLDQ